MTEVNSITLAFKAPLKLERRLRDLAQRESNGLSAVIRRLVSAGLEAEEEKDTSDEPRRSSRL